MKWKSNADIIAGGADTLDLQSMSSDELHALIADARELIGCAREELDRWATVRCYICQRENVSYRGEPFYGWTTSSGYTLCYVCTRRWETKCGYKLTGLPSDNPVDEIMALLD